VINLPGHYNPFRFPERALGRRNLVLAAMAREGYNVRQILGVFYPGTNLAHASGDVTGADG
jgi:hypothetical protein